MGGEPSIITVTFNETNGITNVATSIKYASKADRDAAMSTGMTDGMEMSYKRSTEYWRVRSRCIAHAPSLAFDRTANTIAVDCEERHSTYLRGHLPMRGMKHEDNSFSPDDARAGCRIGAAEANDGLRAGQRTQNVLRSPRQRRSCGVAPRLVHDHHQQLDRVDRRTFQDAESDCRRNAGPRAHGGHRTRHQLRKPRRRCGGAARSPQDPQGGPHRLQHGRRRGDAVCDPPSGQSAQGGRHFVHVPPRRHGQGSGSTRSRNSRRTPSKARPSKPSTRS